MAALYGSSKRSAMEMPSNASTPIDLTDDCMSAEVTVASTGPVRATASRRDIGVVYAEMETDSFIIDTGVVHRTKKVSVTRSSPSSSSSRKQQSGEMAAPSTTTTMMMMPLMVVSKDVKKRGFVSKQHQQRNKSCQIVEVQQ
jgi:hypothetical protein